MVEDVFEEFILHVDKEDDTDDDNDESDEYLLLFQVLQQQNGNLITVQKKNE